MKITIETHCKKCGAKYKGFIPPDKIEVGIGTDPIEIYALDLVCKICSKKFYEIINQ